MEKTVRQYFFHIPSGLKATISILISGVCLAGLLQIRPINLEIFSSVFLLPQLWIATLLTHQLTTLLTAARWKILIDNNDIKSPKIGRLFLVVWASQVATMLPLGFEATRFAYMFKALKMTAAQASKTTVVDRLYELTGFIFVLALALFGFHLGWTALIFLLPVFLLKKQMRILFLVSALKHALKVAAILTVIWQPQEFEFPIIMEMAYKTTFGLLAESLPVSWNGLGVGHLAFEFQIPGQGAEIYSIFFAAKTVWNLLGIFPIIWLGRNHLIIREKSGMNQGRLS